MDKKKKHNRKYRNYLLDKKLQLRYVIFVTTISAIICGVLGYLIWQQADVATNTIREQLASTPELAEEVITSLHGDDQKLVLTMAGAGVFVVGILSLFLILLTHKVAGPLYKVTLYFDKMAKGRLDQVWPLRKGDMLQNFYFKFNSMHVSVRKRHVECNEALLEFIELSEVSGPGGSSYRGQSGSLEKIRKHCKEREDALS